MDAASKPDEDAAVGRSTRLLEGLFSGRARRFQRAGSLIYGLVGVSIFMIGLSALAGSLLGWMKDIDSAAIVVSAACLIAAAVYPTAIVTLQLFASCRLPLAVRLALVYAAVFSFLRAVTFDIHISIDGLTVLACSGICIGGFVQRQFRGWNAIIPWLLMALVGMHGWGRLTSLSVSRLQRDLGFAMWMTGSAIWACFIFLAFVMAGANSSLAVLGFVIAPLTVLVAHLTTAIPIAWLRACGWKFVLAEPCTENSDRAKIQFLDLAIQGQGVVDVTESQQSTGAEKENACEDLAHVNSVDTEEPQKNVQQPGDTLINSSVVVTPLSLFRHRLDKEQIDEPAD